MLPLFDKLEVAGVPRENFAERLHQLATESVYLGTSSWKYPGWLGSIYTEERYRGRSRFSERKFNGTCLSEYAEVFPAVGGDFSFYRFYDAAFWQRLFSQVPSDFQFGLKVPQEITTKMWPKLKRHGVHAGHTNTSFLDAELLRREFLDVLTPHRHQVGALIFEFGTFSRRVYPNGVREFAGELDRFLGELPSGFRYAVEIRNEDFVDPHHFEVLKRHNVAHVFNSWTRMPSLSEQFAIDEAYSADFTVCRALLRPGRDYKEAVRRFEPYEQIQEPYLEGREALTGFVNRAREQGKPTLVFVNNRLEGNAPGTIAAVTEGV